MNLSTVRPDDIVLVDKRGSRFHAHVERKGAGELTLRPIERGIPYRAASAREVLAHWRKSASSRC